MAIDDGGPCYPVQRQDVTTTFTQGLSVRDWFAGQALGEALASWGAERPDAAQIAARCYEFADAMLKAREAG